jgi:hypothetical protein
MLLLLRRTLQLNCKARLLTNRHLFYALASALLLVSCKEETVDFSPNNCKRNPAFIQSFGFKPANSFFSTSDPKKMGLWLMESSMPGNPNASLTKEYQHPSWKRGGWLAPVLLDNNGNLFTAPAPFINVLNNPASNQNTIYRVDGRTGMMEEFLRLPIPDSTIQNPFGIISMAFLCETSTLYVSTVAGSDRQHERGGIYAIDVESKTIIDKITGRDVMGMGITYKTGQRKLFFGTGRSSDIWAVTLTEKGRFSGAPSKAFSLQDLGPRGDDKVRRINASPQGDLIIAGMEFNFNLIAPREKQETSYTFTYSEDDKKWAFQPN